MPLLRSSAARIDADDVAFTFFVGSVEVFFLFRSGLVAPVDDEEELDAVAAALEVDAFAAEGTPVLLVVVDA